MDRQHNNGTRQRARRGVSLIEVLVVLVILVTGILTIIRLFPSGFFSIQSTGNAQAADGLGAAAIDLGAQNSNSLPEAILTDDLSTALFSDSLTNAAATSAQYSNYDPDDPNTLENARIISNETITIPALVNQQSVYAVKYGPVVMPVEPAQSAAQLPNYLTVNSPNWTALSGNSALAALAQGGTLPPTDLPQDTLVPGQERFLVDLVNKKIAVPYAAYTPDGMTTATSGNPSIIVQDANSYAQKMVLIVTCSDGSVLPVYLDVPAGIARDRNSPYAPFGPDNQTYLADLPGTVGTPGSGNYQGGWFNPTTDYLDNPAGQTTALSTKTWISAVLYRPYTGVVSSTDFKQNVPANNDPYQFKLLSPNIVTSTPPGTGSNTGSIGFNPRAAGGFGNQTRKAKISYITTSWQILREDHDVPALTGTGSTFVVRTTVPNLKLAGSANPDNSINPGIANSGKSLVIMDLDTGLIIAPGGTVDPTNPDKPINNEDVNGTTTDPSLINISYSLGRLTFGSDAFGDNNNNAPAIGAGTAPAHRIRIFYTADLDWAVAVQKAAANYQRIADVVPATDPLIGAGQCAFDPQGKKVLYFPRSDYGKTVEIDNLTAYDSSGNPIAASSPAIIVAIGKETGDTLDTLSGNQYWSVSAVSGYLPASLYPKGPNNAYVTFSVRGLSSRSVVAWKERNQYKVHSVDAVLNRTP